MTPVLVDSNVLLDIALADPVWEAWSSGALNAVADKAVLVMNPVIYAELAPAFVQPADIDRTFPPADVLREELPYPAAFLAGRMHRRYRRLGGARERTLPDFLIGAHATVSGYQLLTRDARRYRTYFPKLEIIAPEPG